MRLTATDVQMRKPVYLRTLFVFILNHVKLKLLLADSQSNGCLRSRQGICLTLFLYYFTAIFHPVFTIFNSKCKTTVFTVTDDKNSVLFDAVQGRRHV